MKSVGAHTELAKLAGLTSGSYRRAKQIATAMSRYFELKSTEPQSRANRDVRKSLMVMRIRITFVWSLREGPDLITVLRRHLRGVKPPWKEK